MTAGRDAAERVRELCARVVRDEFFGHTDVARVPVADVLRALGEATDEEPAA